MVPKKVGDELRRRRLSMRLKQADIARAVGRTRAYVSSIERGVEWDPEASILTRWSTELGWEPGQILRMLNRRSDEDSTAAKVILAPEVVDAIKLAVNAGIREGFEAVMEQMRSFVIEARQEAEPLPAPRHRAPPA